MDYAAIKRLIDSGLQIKAYQLYLSHHLYLSKRELQKLAIDPESGVQIKNHIFGFHPLRGAVDRPYSVMGTTSLVHNITMEQAMCSGDHNTCTMLIERFGKELATLYKVNYDPIKRKRVVKIMLENGATPFGWNNMPIKIACRNGHLEVAKILSKYDKVDFDAQNNVCLKWACEHSHPKMIKYVLKMCNFPTKDSEPLSSAFESGQIENVKILMTIDYELFDESYFRKNLQMVPSMWSDLFRERLKI